ncbi:cell division protein FtsL [Paenibacillus solanacearum]|uniref:cell division protein FtsL n=1 Tax=Paenibacillus solanacearum TaxID=2048548 RepID=UPI001C4034B8|nr:cell division protein FtsL [Paenibacillus solanacearum]
MSGEVCVSKSAASKAIGKSDILKFTLGLKQVEINGGIYISEKSLNDYLAHKQYLDENYSTKIKVRRELGLGQDELDILLTKVIPIGMLCWLGDRTSIFIPRRYVEILRSRTGLKQSAEFVASDEIMKLLGIRDHRVLRRIRDEGLIGETLSESNIFYNRRSSVLSLKTELEKEDKYIKENNLIPSQEAVKYFPYDKTVHRSSVYHFIKSRGIIPFERKYKVQKEHNTYYIPEEAVKKYTKSIEVFVDNDNPMEVLKQGIDNISIPPQVKVTMEWFVRYANRTLANSNGNLRTRTLFARALVNRASMFCEVLKKELFDYSDIELEQLYDWDTLKQKDKAIMSRFLNYLRINLKTKYQKKYTVKDIKLNNEKDEIYEFDTFLAYYVYVKDVEKHCQTAMQDRIYASAWLHVLLTTVNGWRPSDLNLLPNIEIHHLGIDSLDYFEFHRLTKPQSDSILYQIDKMNLTYFEVSKNQFKRNFYVNNSLRMSVATAYAICQLHNEREKDEYIIFFNTKHNQSYKSVWKHFFNKTKLSEYSTLKMNRSLLTYLYNDIKDKSGESYLAYIASMAIRNHDWGNEISEFGMSETTKGYLRQISKEGMMDNAVVELFNRGEFGYLYYLITEGAKTECGKNLTMSQETTLINHIQTQLTPRGLESLADFLAFSESRRTTLATEVSKLNGTQLRKMIDQIYLGHLPSKSKNVQCFKHPCPYPAKSENDCISCEYGIPFAAVMGSIANELNLRIQNILNENNFANMLRDRSVIHSLMERVREAVKDLGVEYVEEYLNLTDLQEQLGMVSERIESIKRAHRAELEG